MTRMMILMLQYIQASRYCCFRNYKITKLKWQNYKARKRQNSATGNRRSYTNKKSKILIDQLHWVILINQQCPDQLGTTTLEDQLHQYHMIEIYINYDVYFQSCYFVMIMMGVVCFHHQLSSSIIEGTLTLIKIIIFQKFQIIK